MIMDRLYGGVCYAGIDTDPELKYPKVSELFVCEESIKSIQKYLSGRRKSRLLKPAELHRRHICALCPTSAWRDWQKSWGGQDENNWIWKIFFFKYCLFFFILFYNNSHQRWNHTSLTTSYATSVRVEGILINRNKQPEIVLYLHSLLRRHNQQSNDQNVHQMRRQVCAILLRQRYLSAGKNIPNKFERKPNIANMIWYLKADWYQYSCSTTASSAGPLFTADQGGSSTNLLSKKAPTGWSWPHYITKDSSKDFNNFLLPLFLWSP